MEITEAAIRLLDRIERPEGSVLRIQAKGNEGGIGLVLGASLEDDIVLRPRGHQPLHLPAYLRLKFARAVLDRVDTPSGPSLALRPPG